MGRKREGAKRTPSGAKAKKIEVIRTENAEGIGTPEDPVRTIVRYWELDGTLITEQDPLFGCKLFRRKL